MWYPICASNISWILLWYPYQHYYAVRVKNWIYCINFFCLFSVLFSYFSFFLHIPWKNEWKKVKWEYLDDFCELGRKHIMVLLMLVLQLGLCHVSSLMNNGNVLLLLTLVAGSSLKLEKASIATAYISRSINTLSRGLNKKRSK